MKQYVQLNQQNDCGWKFITSSRQFWRGPRFWVSWYVLVLSQSQLKSGITRNAPTLLLLLFHHSGRDRVQIATSLVHQAILKGRNERNISHVHYPLEEIFCSCKMEIKPTLLILEESKLNNAIKEISPILGKISA